MRVIRIDKTSSAVVNVEAWDALPAETDTESFVASNVGQIGDTYSNGVITPAPPPLASFTPAQIVAAFNAMGVANTILANTDELTKARFYTATSVREDAPELLAALQAVGKTISDLKAQIT